MPLTIEDIRKKGWIVYEYIRGSIAYGLNTPTSDIDRGGVFICPPESLLGLRSKYVEQVSDANGDTVFYEFGRWIELLLKSNPTVLESLYIPQRCIIGHTHPMIQHIIDNRDMFLSKECFKTLTGYAISQIGKARGLNKKIVNPIVERKSVLDFCYVPYGQGTKKVADWLRDNGLKQKYCGLVALSNMHDVYGLYYDWGTHLICEYGADLKFFSNKDNVLEILNKEQMQSNPSKKPFWTVLKSFCPNIAYEDIRPFGFSGIVNDDGESNDVRITTVPKNIQPLIVMSYNKSGYQSHCRDFNEYQQWVKNRNPIRYESNLNQNYDGKNMSHCLRLIRMGKELSQGKGFNVDRTEIDRDFLLSIKNHELEYGEIMRIAEAEKKEMEGYIDSCTLPEKIDTDAINRLLINARKIYYGDLDNKLI